MSLGESLWLIPVRVPTLISGSAIAAIEPQRALVSAWRAAESGLSATRRIGDVHALACFRTSRDGARRRRSVAPVAGRVSCQHVPGKVQLEHQVRLVVAESYDRSLLYLCAFPAARTFGTGLGSQGSTAAAAR